MNNIIEALKWRYATKKYNADKKISTEDFETLKEVLTLVPTSSGIQALKFLVIENPEIRKQLQAVSYNQSQIVDASHLIVMCAYNEYTEDHANDFINLSKDIRQLSEEGVSNFRNYLNFAVLPRPIDKQMDSHAKQTYIALGMLLSAAAEMNIDATPMEGFLPEEYDRILGLEGKNLKSIVICALGYRADDDANASYPKVRKPLTEMIETI